MLKYLKTLKDDSVEVALAFVDLMKAIATLCLLVFMWFIKPFRHLKDLGKK